MAMTVSITGDQVVPTTADEERFFGMTTGAGIAPPTTLCVKNDASASGDARIRIPHIHGGSQSVGYARLAAGDKEYFRFGDGELLAAYVEGGDCILTWYPVAGTKTH